jgi:hypothetical protein
MPESVSFMQLSVKNQCLFSPQNRQELLGKEKNQASS